jgi:hypothetical protein
MKCKEQEEKKSWRFEAGDFDIGEWRDFELDRTGISALGIFDGEPV